MIFPTGGDHLRNHQTATQSRLHKVGFQTRPKVSMNSRACFIKATSLRPWKVLQSLSLIPSSVHVFSVSRYTLSSLLDISSTPRYYTNWTRLLLTCVIPLVALVVFNTKIFLGIRCLPLFYHFGCAAFVLFFGIFCPEQNLCFLWYFAAPMIDIDTIDSLSLDALTCWFFHPNRMSNSPMNERNNSLPSEFNSNTQIHRQDTTLLLSQHNTVFMHKFFCLISLGLWNM